MDMATLRENTEDVYAGLEWEEDTDAVEQVREFVEDEMGFDDAAHEGPIGLGRPIPKQVIRRSRRGRSRRRIARSAGLRRACRPSPLPGRRR